jgi:hypothetical protein
VPYEVSFVKPVPIVDRDYINDCCIGGDIVVDRLLPTVRERYQAIQSNQEDWGWFIWFKKDAIGLAIDVFTDSAEHGQFRIHLTSHTKRLFSRRVADTPELEELRTMVESELKAWGAGEINTTHLDKNYM